MGDSPGEDEAVAASGQGFADVVDDLNVAAVVGDKSAMCLGDGARRSDVERVEAKCGFVNMQNTTRAGGRHQCVGEAHLLGEGVADRSELPGDEFAEAVAAGGGGGQPEPELGTDPLDGMVVGRRRKMVAFVDDDMPVAAG